MKGLPPIAGRWQWAGSGREGSGLEGQARMGSGSLPDTCQPAEHAQWPRELRQLPPWTLADVGLEPQASEPEALAAAQKAVGARRSLRFPFCPRCSCPCTALGQSLVPCTWRSARLLCTRTATGASGDSPTRMGMLTGRWPEPGSLGTSLGPGAPSTCL